MVRHLILTSSNLLKKTLNTQLRFVTRAMSSAEDDVLFYSNTNAGLITLNRPKALNALNLPMVEKLTPKLKEWEHEKALVVIKGAGGKAFCAGGDVRAVTESGLKGGRYGHDFFMKEYIMNGIIGTYAIPYVALIDGIVMGGGVGLSVHGPYRVATERTVFAMPESTIGLFPDVGGSHFLPRLGGKLGLYLALTSARLTGPDVLKAGIATHYVESASIADLETELLQCKNEHDVTAVLKKFNKDPAKDFSLQSNMNEINQCFSAQTIEEIISNLKKSDSKFAQDTLKQMSNKCPTSMKVTLKQLEKGAKMNLLECLQMEYRISTNCLKNKNFYEGVRALLIDKDQNPKWIPATLEEVSDAFVDSHFEKLPDSDELKHKL